MTIIKTRLGTNDDGSPHFHYHCPDGHLVKTGPITGPVALPDGTVYDVTEEFIEVASLERGDAYHEDEGHPQHRPTAGDQDPVAFVHVCSDHCGELARTPEETIASFEARTNVDHPRHAQHVAAIRAAHINPER